MSYIEEKYYDKILKTFEGLTGLQDKLVEIFEEKSIKRAEEIAKHCSQANKKINLILKKYYPEIKDIDKKLNIKSNLKFYFDLIDKLTDFIRHVENFNKIDDQYFEVMVEFLKNRDSLIEGKYKTLATQELTTFYDKQSRANLEKILEYKLDIHEKNFFTFGSLEQEIKKIGKFKGADFIKVYSMKNFSNEMKSVKNSKYEQLNSIIQFGIFMDVDKVTSFVKNGLHEQFSSYKEKNMNKLFNIGEEIIDFLKSKNYKAKNLVENIQELKVVKKPVKSSVFYEQLKKYITQGAQKLKKAEENNSEEFTYLENQLLQQEKNSGKRKLLFFSFILTSAKLLIEGESSK
jgi:hypothetical protein